MEQLPASLLDTVQSCASRWWLGLPRRCAGRNRPSERDKSDYQGTLSEESPDIRFVMNRGQVPLVAFFLLFHLAPVESLRGGDPTDREGLDLAAVACDS